MTHKKSRTPLLLTATILCAALLALATPASAKNTSPEETVQVEQNGKLVTVPLSDVMLISSDNGYKLAAQPQDELPVDDFESAVPSSANDGRQEISAREYEEEQRARQWANITENLTLREIDKKALELVKEFDKAKGAVPPTLGSAGSVVFTYASHTPKIICRPMFVTDVILQPGETVTGVHPGDPVRWSFTPGRSGAEGSEQIHVLIKPLMADISTNLVVNTDRRTYHLDLVSKAKDFMPSVSFTYPQDTLTEWDKFIAEREEERRNNIEIGTGHTINPEDLHLAYEIRGSDSLRWKPTNVYDDGVKTYIKFRSGSAIRSVEAPIFIVFEKRKETIVNYRVAKDMYIVDKVFDKGALIVGTGSRQDRVVITRLAK